MSIKRIPSNSGPNISYLSHPEYELKRGLSPCGNFKGCKGLEDFTHKRVCVTYKGKTSEIETIHKK